MKVSTLERQADLSLRHILPHLEEKYSVQIKASPYSWQVAGSVPNKIFA